MEIETILRRAANNGGYRASDAKYYWASYQREDLSDEVWVFPDDEKAISWAKYSGVAKLWGPYGSERDATDSVMVAGASPLWSAVMTLEDLREFVSETMSLPVDTPVLMYDDEQDRYLNARISIEMPNAQGINPEDNQFVAIRPR